MSGIEEVAEGLVLSLGADNTPDNIEGTARVLKAMVAAVNADWEEYITQDTNELLAEDNVCCDCCGTPITIKRLRHVLYVLNS